MFSTYWVKKLKLVIVAQCPRSLAITDSSETQNQSRRPLFLLCCRRKALKYVVKMFIFYNNNPYPTWLYLSSCVSCFWIVVDIGFVHDLPNKKEYNTISTFAILLSFQLYLIKSLYSIYRVHIFHYIHWIDITCTLWRKMRNDLELLYKDKCCNSMRQFVLL